MKKETRNKKQKTRNKLASALAATMAVGVLGDKYVTHFKWSRK